MKLSARTLAATTEWLLAPEAHAHCLAIATATDPAAFWGEPPPPLTPEQRAALLPKVQKLGQGLARLDITGVMLHRPDDQELRDGAAPTEHLATLVRDMAADPAITRALIVFDSPGGQVTGTADLADAVRALATLKPTVALVDGMAASAAYWVAAQAGTIVATPASSLGSIGVYAAMFDISALLAKYGVKVEVFKNAAADLKAMGVPGVPLSESQRAHMQDRIEGIAADFHAAVLTMRPAVQADTLRGQTFDARSSIARGLADTLGRAPDALRLLHR